MNLQAYNIFLLLHMQVINILVLIEKIKAIFSITYSKSGSYSIKKS